VNILYSILPEKLRYAFERLPIDRVYELRLRCNRPAVVTINSRSYYLTDNGPKNDPAEGIIITSVDLETILHKASDYSLYAVNDQLKQGFITIRGGVRIGICGEYVTTTIKNISSLNIRVPHEVRGCSYSVLPYIFTDERPLKTLIISPPGAGKTTFLRDLALNVCEKYMLPNVLILDERGEIAANYMGENQLDVGASDVLTGASKTYGFENGVRSMRPDVIITDELSGREDLDMVRLAARSGVCVFASVHARDIDEIRLKPHWRELIEDGVFDRYVVLTTRDTAGAVVGVYDRMLKPIHTPPC